MAERKKSIRTRKNYTFINGALGGKLLTKSERDKILNPLHQYEFEGEGIPETIVEEGECPFTDFNFDIRIFHDAKGTLELSIYRKGSKNYTFIDFEGLSKKQSCQAKRVFERNIIHLIKQTCFNLATASYEKQTDNFEKKKEILDAIKNDASIQYKEILELVRERVIEEYEKNGVTTTRSELIDVGAKPQSKRELEEERQKFIEEIYFALKKFKQNHVIEPKQKNLMSYMFEGYRDKEKKISTMMKKHNLKFDRLWMIFNAADKYQDFVSRVLSSIRVTTK